MEPDQIYESLRKRVEGEHGYISSRIGWLLTSQGIFLAVLKLSGAAIAPSVNDFIQSYLPILALLVSLFSTANVIAAVLTIDALVNEERRLFTDERSKQKTWPGYLETKRPRWVHPASMFLTAAIPFTTSLFWFMLVLA